MKKEQHRPYCIQVEPVFGCNLRCSMCGINSTGLGRNEFRFMNLDTAKTIAKSIKNNWPKIRIEFAMCGEPTIHPQIEEILSIFRENLPEAHLLFTTNGVSFLGGQWELEWSKKLSYCNIIAVDLYNPYGLKLKEQLLRHPENWVLKDYYIDEFNQHKYHNPSEGRFLVMIDDLSNRTDRKRKQRTLFNHAGNSALTPPLNNPVQKVCTFPFREMVIRYNGVVNICCLDFGSELDMGNINEQDLVDIWYGDKFNLIRKFLRHKNRTFSPCNVCDMPGGFRQGILPDYPNPSEGDLEKIKEIHNNSQKYNNKSFVYKSYQKKGLIL